MWKRLLVAIVALGLVAGSYFGFSMGSSNNTVAVDQFFKYYAQWQNHPDTYASLLSVLTLYHWPTAETSSLAHKLAYEVQAYENGVDRSGDWDVTYLLMMASLGGKFVP